MKNYPDMYTDKFKHLFQHMTSSSYFLEQLVIKGRLTYSGFLGLLPLSNNVEERRWNGLRIYLQLLCDEKELFNCNEMKLFLGIGSTSFRPDLGRKGFAGYLKKPATFKGLVPEWATNRALEIMHEKCWVVLHDNCIGVFHNSISQQPIDVIEVDADFKFVRMGHEFEIKTKSGLKYFRANTKSHAIEWEDNVLSFYKNILSSKLTKEKISKVSKSYSKTIRGSNNVNESFSPERMNNDVGIFTYSKDYMASLTLALLSAKKEICIASWKLSPTILLTRDDMPPIRLDQLLIKKASSGILINIMLYQEVGLAAQGNDSSSAQQYFERLHPNICCQRHGCDFSNMMQWSHHEKLVIIDRSVAFVGGIDLAFHRWDDEAHQLFDISGIKFPGKDYSQPAKKQYQHPKSKVAAVVIKDNGTNILMGRDTDLVVKNKDDVRTTTPRLPWHDIHCYVKGLAAVDITCHFIERWNIISTKMHVGLEQKQWRLLQPTDDKYFGICAACGSSDIEENCKKCPTCSHNLGPISSYIENDNDALFNIESPDSSRFTHITYSVELNRFNLSLYKGNSPLFQNVPVIGAILEDNKLLHKAGANVINTQHSVSGTVITRHAQQKDGENMKNLISRGLKPQVGDILLTINDEAVSHLDEESIKNILAAADNGESKKFIFRRFYTMKRIDSDQIFICEQSITLEFELQMSLFYHKYARRIDSSCLKSSPGSCNVQAIRSIGPWSIGWKASRKETSIYKCYLNEIKNAEHFIYIENQFFISNLANDTAQNVIADTIVKKIVEKAIQNKMFHVTIILPQYPTGDYTTKVSTQSIMHYQYATIRNTIKILQLYYDDEYKKDVALGNKNKKENILNYIDFFCLRKGGYIDEHFTSSQIYVHDKLMIVDDKVMIVGSANINDRSMLGNRDSEVALRIEDTNLITIQMNGQPYQASSLVHHLRVKLMGQHIGSIEIYEKYNYPNLPQVDLVSEIIQGSSDISTFEHLEKLVNERLDPTDLEKIESTVKYVKSDMKDYLASYKNWRNTAIYNTLIYKVLDDKCDVYSSLSLSEFASNIHNTTRYLHESDTRLNHKKKLKGFLVLFPVKHLIDANLRSAFIPPSLVT